MHRLKLTILSGLLVCSGAAFGQIKAGNVVLPVLPDSVNVTVPADGKTVYLTREECVRIALSDNPTLKVAGMEIERADYSKKENRASLFPKVDFAAAYQRTIELQTVSMNMGGQSQSFKMGTDNNWNLGFSASLPIIAPQLWKSLQMSDTQILQNMESARASRLDMIHQVNTAYYSLMLAIASREVIRQNYDIAVYNADIYKKQFEQGTATEYDVLRSSVQVKNVEPSLLEADIAIRQCSLQLKVLLGITDDVEISTSDRLENYQRDMYSYVMTNTSESALSANSSLRSLDIQTRLLEQTVSLKKLAWVPTLAASAAVNWNAMNNGSPFKNVTFFPYSTVGLSVSVPIFSGGSKYYGLKGAEVQLKEMSLQRENLLSSLQMQMELALDNINKEVKQIDSSREGVAQAEKAHEIMQKSFEIGAATYLDLRDSELANTSARLSYYQAIYNFLVSTSELDLLLGKESELASPSADYNTQFNKIINR